MKVLCLSSYDSAAGSAGQEACRSRSIELCSASNKEQRTCNWGKGLGFVLVVSHGKTVALQCAGLGGVGPMPPRVLTLASDICAGRGEGSEGGWEGGGGGGNGGGDRVSGAAARGSFAGGVEAWDEGVFGGVQLDCSGGAAAEESPVALAGWSFPGLVLGLEVHSTAVGMVAAAVSGTFKLTELADLFLMISVWDRRKSDPRPSTELAGGTDDGLLDSLGLGSLLGVARGFIVAARASFRSCFACASRICLCCFW